MFLVEHIMLREPELSEVRPLSLSEHIEVEALIYSYWVVILLYRYLEIYLPMVKPPYDDNSLHVLL